MASGHQMGRLLLDRTLNDGAVIPDPGAEDTIAVTQSGGVCHLTIAASTAETRVLPDPTVGTSGMGVGTQLTVVCNQKGASGSCAITDGLSNTFNFLSEGDAVLFQVVTVDDVKVWRGTQLINGKINSTGKEIDRVADVSTRIVDVTTPTLTVTEADHDGKTLVLDRAAGIAVTLPSASAGLKFRFIVKTTFAAAATIKSVASADIMIGHALMGNNSDNSVVDWQSVAASTNDTIDLFGTANSTGGIEGQVVTIEGLAANLWFVEIRGDAAGTEATPFANTVS